MQRERGNKLRRTVSAFTLVELLIVLVLVSILAKIAISSTSPNAYEELNSTATIVTGELMYARGLAVGNNSTYRFDLDTTNNQLVMRNTGSDPTLTTLPSSPFRSASDPSDQYIVAFARIPTLGMPVVLLGGQTSGASPQSLTSVEFGPYGSTTQVNTTVIWLTAGSGTSRRFMSVTVNPVTGLAAVGSYTASAPGGMTIPAP
jgi:prepilin-type N-terminal cleavage/methylation domain-containing protein